LFGAFRSKQLETELQVAYCEVNLRLEQSLPSRHGTVHQGGGSALMVVNDPHLDVSTSAWVQIMNA
jgi:hypothetical protein